MKIPDTTTNYSVAIHHAGENIPFEDLSCWVPTLEEAKREQQKWRGRYPECFILKTIQQRVE